MKLNEVKVSSKVTLRRDFPHGNIKIPAGEVGLVIAITTHENMEAKAQEFEVEFPSLSRPIRISGALLEHFI